MDVQSFLQEGHITSNTMLEAEKIIYIQILNNFKFTHIRGVLETYLEDSKTCLKGGWRDLATGYTKACWPQDQSLYIPVLDYQKL